MQRGLSLIELLIVLAVIGILAGVAYPAYSEQLRRVARSEAVGLLHDAAQRLQRHHARSGRYTDGEQQVTLPSGSRFYTLHALREADNYRLLARPVVGTMMEQDNCGDFQMDHLGVHSNPDSSEDPLQCWAG